jgi:protein tyrosine phosphatase
MLPTTSRHRREYDELEYGEPTTLRCHSKLSVKKLQENKITMPSETEFEELEDRDGRRYNKMADFTTILGQNCNFDGLMNLDPEVLPYDFNRVRLKTPIKGLDYVNASWMVRARKDKDAFNLKEMRQYLPFSMMNIILTQDPVNNSMPSYYQMIHERKVDIVLKIGSHNMNETENIHQSFGHMDRKLIKRKQIYDFLTKETVCTFYNTSNNFPRNTQIFTFEGWPTDENFSEEMTTNFLLMISMVRRETIRKRGTTTILSQDSAGGISGASAFVVLYQLLEQYDDALFPGLDDSIDENSTLDVFDVVDESRKLRSLVISNFSEYQFLFRSLVHYAQNREEFDYFNVK